MTLHATLSPSSSYRAAHARLVRRRGSASTHACVDCGNQASDWSYDYNDPEETTDWKGRRYGLSVMSYSPRCRTCHIDFDHKKDPTIRERVTAASKSVPSEVRRKAGLASLHTPAGKKQRHDRAVKGGMAAAEKRRKK